MRKEEFVGRNKGLAIDVLEGIHKYSSTLWEALELYLEITKESIECYVHIKVRLCPLLIRLGTNLPQLRRLC